MTKTLILVFHYDLGKSRTNAALGAAARTLPDVEIVDMQALYNAEGAFDTEAEVARLLAAGRIVLQFPVQWYATPPLLKAWQDAVLTRMFYIAYESEGRKLAGRPVLVVATAGNTPDAYTSAGMNLFPLAELLRPLQATAHRCGLIWSEPFLVYRANKLADAELESEAHRYAKHLREWSGASSAQPAVAA